MFVPVHERLTFLGLTKKLGCGHEGCVYSTDHNTVVKTAQTKYALQELAVAEALQPLAGRHRIVPRIFGTGRLDEGLLAGGVPLVWIEREPLNDLQLSDEGEAQFTDSLGRLLGGVAGAKVPSRLPSYVPAQDRKLLMQLAIGFDWLRRHGFDLQDHNTSENWGVRADGSVALRDLGRIEMEKS